MAENSKIEWTHHTANLWWGCTEVHAGCDNCYARVLANRWNFDIWGNDKYRRRIESVFKDLDKYQRKAAQANEIHRVFVGSMMDIFEKSTLYENPYVHYLETGDTREEFFSRIIADLYPNLMLLLLTKRPSNIYKMVPAGWMDVNGAPPNIMYGTSPVDQKTADTIIPQLLKVPGRKFLSVEPQIAELSLKPYLQGIDWVISGGESGHHKRPFNTDWARKLRDECAEAEVPFFFKQVDKIQPIPDDLKIREFPN